MLRRAERSVTRRCSTVEFGDLTRARRGRMGGWYYLLPGDLGLPFEDVLVPTPVGDCARVAGPCARRSDSLGDPGARPRGHAPRGVACGSGLPRTPDTRHCSSPIATTASHPSSVDARYALGDTEWEDVAAAVEFAQERGARDVVIMGWSMGGAIALADGDPCRPRRDPGRRARFAGDRLGGGLGLPSRDCCGCRAWSRGASTG